VGPATPGSNSGHEARSRRDREDWSPMSVSLKIPLVVVDDADLGRVSRENSG
jgi:hypothetical protein